MEDSSIFLIDDISNNIQDKIKNWQDKDVKLREQGMYLASRYTGTLVDVGEIQRNFQEQVDLHKEIITFYESMDNLLGVGKATAGHFREEMFFLQQMNNGIGQFRFF